MEFFLGGLGLSALLLYLGWSSLKNDDRRGNFLLVGAAVIMIVTGLFVAMDNGLEVQSDCMNASYENSYVWEGYCNVTDLFPTEFITNPTTYSLENGVLTAGTIANVYTHDGTYLQIKENGAGFNITFNFTVPVVQCPTNMKFVGRYQGPANRYFTWYVYNWTSGAFQNTGLADVTASSSDAVYEYGCPASSDYFDIDTRQLLMKMVTTNAAAGAYYIYTDELQLSSISPDSYSVQTRTIDCTRDQYNTTYDYGACYANSMDFGYSEMLGIILMLLGLGVFLGILTWSKFKEW